MTDQPQAPAEEIPNRHIMTELEAQLHSKTSELVVAHARIRTRDETIARLQRELDTAVMETSSLNATTERFQGTSAD